MESNVSGVSHANLLFLTAYSIVATRCFVGILSHSTTKRPEDRRYWSLDKSCWVDFPPLPKKEKPKKRKWLNFNGFITFKQYVDGIPAAIASPFVERKKRKQQRLLARREEEHEWMTKWYGNTCAARAVSDTDKKSAEFTALALLRLAEAKNKNVLSSDIDSLFVERGREPASMADQMLAFGGAAYFLPEVGDFLPSAATLCRSPPRRLPWLSLEWFKRSQYSPIQLEESQDMKSEHWRFAFEDLLAVQLGWPLPLRRNVRAKNYLSPEQSGLGWVLTLLSDGFLPTLAPSKLGHSSTPTSGLASLERSSGSRQVFNEVFHEIQSSQRVDGIESVTLRKLGALHDLKSRQTPDPPKQSTRSLLSNPASWFWHTGPGEQSTR
jgi:hypothetical protein